MQAWLNEEKQYHGEAIGQGKFEDWGHYSKSLDLIEPLATGMQQGADAERASSTVHVEKYDECRYGCSDGRERRDIYCGQVFASW